MNSRKAIISRSSLMENVGYATVQFTFCKYVFILMIHAPLD